MCLIRHSQIHASVNTDIQCPVGETQASYQVLRKNSSPCRTSLVTYFGVAGVSLPLLIFPSTHHSFTRRRFPNTPVPRGRQAPDWHLPGLNVLPRNSGWLWGPPKPTKNADISCGSAAAPLSRCSGSARPNAQGNEAAQ